MLRKRRILSYCLAFMMVLTVFRGSSILAEAATVDKSFDIIYTGVDYNIPTITVNEGDTINVTLNIKNQSGIGIIVGGGTNVTATSSLFISNEDTKTLTFSIVDGSTYAALNVMTDDDHYLIFSIEYNTTPSSGGGDSYEGSSTGDSDEGNSTVQKESKSNHTHSYFWSEEKAATEDTDGEMVYRCECGAVQYRVPISAYYVFNKNTMEKIKKADKGATVKIETSKWISFHKMVMQALADRPDVSLDVSFLDGEYKGNRVSFIIPAGTDTLSLLDDNGFAGFLYLAGKLGMTN